MVLTATLLVVTGYLYVTNVALVGVFPGVSTCRIAMSPHDGILIFKTSNQALHYGFVNPNLTRVVILRFQPLRFRVARPPRLESYRGRNGVSSSFGARIEALFSR
jgi:hypothetical protein